MTERIGSLTLALAALGLVACGNVEYDNPSPAPAPLVAADASAGAPLPAAPVAAIQCNGPVNDGCPSGTVCCPTSQTCVPASAVGDCESSTVYFVNLPDVEIPSEIPDPAEGLDPAGLR